MESYFMGVEEASKKLDIPKQKLRYMLRGGNATFGTCYKASGDSYSYVIDRKALERCMKGEQNFFKGGYDGEDY